jgi:glycosyltransferase involved in cell wall biosynthesis
MRITFVNRFAWPDHSATSQLLSDLAAFLSANGATVTLVASRLRYDEGPRLPERETWRGVEVRRIWTSSFGRGSLLGRALDYLTFYLSLPFTLWSCTRRGDVVVAMTDPPLLSLVALPVTRLRGAIPVNWVQDLFPEVAVALGKQRIGPALAGLLAWFRDASLRSARANVAIGEAMAARLRARHIPSVEVIPNWPHEDAIQPMPSAQSRLRQRLQLGERFVVGYSGNLGRAHDWRAILELARCLVPHSEIVFLIGGGGQGYEALRRQAELERIPNLQFQPYHPMEYLSDSMAAADLHLVSLRPEMEGLVVPSKFYGIAAAQRPVGFIGDPEGELGRLIRENGIGFALPASVPARLAEAVLALARDPQACREQGWRARNLLERRFSRHEAHRRWHHLLTNLESKSKTNE